MALSGSKLLVSSALRAAANLNSSKIPSELAKSSAAFLSSAPSGGKVFLPDLPYDYGALERAS
jgi:Fe-Mn family superoxide dismutase